MLNFNKFFYKKIINAIKLEEICALKLLIAIDLNIYRLFLKKIINNNSYCIQKIQNSKIANKRV